MAEGVTFECVHPLPQGCWALLLQAVLHPPSGAVLSSFRPSFSSFRAVLHPPSGAVRSPPSGPCSPPSGPCSPPCFRPSFSSFRAVIDPPSGPCSPHPSGPRLFSSFSRPLTSSMMPLFFSFGSCHVPQEIDPVFLSRPSVPLEALRMSADQSTAGLDSDLRQVL